MVHDNPLPAAAGLAGMAVPIEYGLPVASEALQGVPAPVVAGKAQAGLADGLPAFAGRFE